MDAAARVLRTAFDQALPWLAGLHTPEEDRWFFRKRVFKTCEVWGAFDGTGLIGVLAFRDRWIDQLYVLPNARGLLRVLARACISGRSSATRTPGDFTRPEVLPWWSKLTVREMRRRSPMRSIYGHADGLMDGPCVEVP